MNNRCKIIVDGKEYFFVFDNNSLLEFCDLVGIEIGEFEQYAQTHKGTLSRGLFYSAALVAAKMSLLDYNNIRHTMTEEQKQEFESKLFTMNEMDFGNLMAKFTADDYRTLLKAFEASRPVEKKKIIKSKFRKAKR